MTILLADAPAPADAEPVAVRPRLQVDLSAVAANTRLFARRTDAQLMAVVKADGFGHGATDLARTALANGATWLGVTSLDEASALRRAGIVAPLLSWLNPVHADFELACRQRVDVAVPSVDHLMAVRAAAAVTGRRARVHLHLDTGMARDGAPPQQWRTLMVLARTAEQHGLLDVVGVMGHLACADLPGHPANKAGRQAFLRGADLAHRAGLRPRVRHLAATAAALTDRRSHVDLIRVGAGLVGIDPSGTTALRPALTLTA
ncbi:alanine racemase, partial [Nocardioides sp.]|uniref:alanine racemase n=1 Tax=Nocardioides sp. TaxID=35761 RepID=UPI00273684B2